LKIIVKTDVRRARLVPVLVVMRYRVPESEDGTFRAMVAEVLALLAARPGYLDASLGRAADDPTLWLLLSRWQDVGTYRRALSSYDVKICLIPLQRLAFDEPSAYEIILGDGAYTSNRAKPRGEQ
jgi:quinol monooxygenase YgiN